MSGGRKKAAPRATHVPHQEPSNVPGGHGKSTGKTGSGSKKMSKKARKKRNARIREQLDERGHIVNAKTIRARLAAAKEAREAAAKAQEQAAVHADKVRRPET